MNEIEQLARDIYLRRVERGGQVTTEHLVSQAFADAEKFYAELEARKGRAAAPPAVVELPPMTAAADAQVSDSETNVSSFESEPPVPAPPKRKPKAESRPKADSRQPIATDH
jgi:hypothetical protein